MRTVRRGYIDRDEILFGGVQREKILDAAVDARWLMDRGYGKDSAITFTGNHYMLTERQRTAMARSIMPESELKARKSKEQMTLGKEVLIDGLNTIITLETALSHSVVLRGDDGALRDVAGLHGTYRIIDKTATAIDLVLSELSELHVRKAVFLLDRPVSNSGSLKKLIIQRADGLDMEVEVILDDNPDNLMTGRTDVISSDGPVLEKSAGWFNLSSRIVSKMIPQAWVFGFNHDEGETPPSSSQQAGHTMCGPHRP